MGQVDEDNLTEFGRGLFTSLSPTVASSSLLGNRLKAVRKLQLVNTVMDGLAVGRTLKHGAFAATTVHVNPIYAITLLGPVSWPVRFIGWAGVGRPRGGQRAGGAARWLWPDGKATHYFCLCTVLIYKV